MGALRLLLLSSLSSRSATTADQKENQKLLVVVHWLDFLCLCIAGILPLLQVLAASFLAEWENTGWDGKFHILVSLATCKLLLPLQMNSCTFTRGLVSKCSCQFNSLLRVVFFVVLSNFHVFICTSFSLFVCSDMNAYDVEVSSWFSVNLLSPLADLPSHGLAVATGDPSTMLHVFAAGEQL